MTLMILSCVCYIDQTVAVICSVRPAHDVPDEQGQVARSAAGCDDDVASRRAVGPHHCAGLVIEASDLGRMSKE